MKSLVFSLLFLSLGTAFAASPSETFNPFKVSVSTTTPTLLSAYSASRARLVCSNSGSIQVYIGTSTVITSAGATTFEVSPGTGTYNTFETKDIGQLYGIGLAGPTTGTSTVYCIEER